MPDGYALEIFDAKLYKYIYKKTKNPEYKAISKQHFATAKQMLKEHKSKKQFA